MLLRQTPTDVGAGSVTAAPASAPRSTRSRYRPATPAPAAAAAAAAPPSEPSMAPADAVFTGRWALSRQTASAQEASAPTRCTWISSGSSMIRWWSAGRAQPGRPGQRSGSCQRAGGCPAMPVDVRAGEGTAVMSSLLPWLSRAAGACSPHLLWIPALHHAP